MPRYLCISVRFLDPLFHGKGDGGKPEWPPSPLRLFQALVAAAARIDGLAIPDVVRSGLEWLAALSERRAPVIIAPRGIPTHRGYRLFVPNNDMDVPAGYWSEGKKPPANQLPHKLRDDKSVRPTRLIAGDTVWYTWELPEEDAAGGLFDLEQLKATARGMVSLGWGVDLVVGNCSEISTEEFDEIQGERWIPFDRRQPGNVLRAPSSRTWRALAQRHGLFLERVYRDDLPRRTPDLPPSAYELVSYRRDTEPLPRYFVAFQLLNPDWQELPAAGSSRHGSEYRAFSLYRPAEVAAMLRYTIATVARTYQRPESWIRSFVLGYGDGPNGEFRGGQGANRFAYVPLPTIDRRGVVGSIRRILVVESPGGSGSEVAWARRALEVLLREGTPQAQAILSVLEPSDPRYKVVNWYTGPKEGSSSWSTVTPVLLPGLGARRRREIEDLIRVAIRQGGISTALSQLALLDWQRVGFWAGTDLAARYARPAHLERYPRYHVRIRWRDAQGRPIRIRGPVCLGAGRYYGLGLFAAERDSPE